MTLLEVLLHEQLRDIFTEARRRGRGLNAILLDEQPAGVDELFGGRGAVVRLETTAGGSFLITPRRVSREVGAKITEVAPFDELVGYDWISPDLDKKVAQKAEHYDRLYLHLQGGRTVVLDDLGDAVYPLMTYLGKVLELRSQKVLRRRLGDDVAEVVDRCLQAAVEGPFFTDQELVKLFEQDRPSLAILGGMWARMNLASPDLRRTVEGVVEMLLSRRAEHADAWEEWVGLEPSRVQSALEVFRRVVAGEV